MRKKILILGGTGFIGNHLSKKALEKNFQVTILSKNQAKYFPKRGDINYITADISDKDNLKKELLDSNFDYVVNLSGYVDHSPFSKGGRKVIDTHFYGLQNVIQSINWSGLKRFVQIGSSDEYGNNPAPQNEDMIPSPISPYSLAKTASSQLLQLLSITEKFPAVVLRLFLVYGPDQNKERFLPQIIQGCFSKKSFPYSSGDQLRDFCYVDDIVDGIFSAFESDQSNGEIINIASGKPVKIKEVINKVIGIVGHGEPDYGKIPYRDFENMNLHADISKALKILNWEPKVSLDDGLKLTIDSYKD